MREREESNKRAAEEKRAREEEKARKRKENLKQLGRHLGITLGAIFNIQLQGPVFVWPVTRFLFNMSMWVEEMLQHLHHARPILEIIIKPFAHHLT